MDNLLIIDAHCDTITKIMRTDEELYANSCHLDVARLKEYPSFVQFFAAFVSPEYCPGNAYTRCVDIIRKFEAEMANNKEHICHAKNYQQIIDATDNGKVAAVLTIENGGALEGSIAKLDKFYNLGVRSICLTWNGSNQIACGVGGDNLTGGLTPFGFDVVRRMNELGMLVDVSHINEAGFWDVIGASASPIIASHSNSKKMCNHQRNLTDDQFKALLKNNGVAGINLCVPFLNESGTADINDILRHIDYFMSLGGENHVGLGADLDGISKMPESINGVENMDTIFNGLLSKNYTDEQVRKIAGLNFLRVLKDVL